MAPRLSETKPGPNPTVLTWALFQSICADLSVTGLKIKSCETHGVSSSTVLTAIANQTAAGDLEWEDLWKHSFEKYKETLVGEARSRAVDGWDEPVYHKGAVAGYVQRKSDRLLEIMLKGQVPETFTPSMNMNVSTAQPIEILSDLSLKAKRAIRDIIMQDMAERAALKAAGAQAADAAELGSGQRLIEGTATVVP